LPLPKDVVRASLEIGRKGQAPFSPKYVPINCDSPNRDRLSSLALEVDEELEINVKGAAIVFLKAEREIKIEQQQSKEVVDLCDDETPALPPGHGGEAWVKKKVTV